MSAEPWAPQQSEPHRDNPHSTTYFDWTNRKFFQIYFDIGYYLCVLPFQVTKSSRKLTEEYTEAKIGFGNSSFLLNRWLPQLLLSISLALFSVPSLLRFIVDVFPSNPKDAPKYFLLAFNVINLANFLISINKMWIQKQAFVDIARHLESKPKKCNWRPGLVKFASNKYGIILFCMVYLCWPLSLTLGQDLQSVTNWKDYWENMRRWSCHTFFLDRNGTSNCTGSGIAVVLAIPTKLARYYSQALLCFVRLGLLLSIATLWLAVKSSFASGELFYEEILWLKKLSRLISNTFGHQASCQIFQVVLADSVIIDELFEGNSTTEESSLHLNLFHSLSLIAALLRDIVFLIISADICSQVRKTKFGIRIALQNE